MTKLFDGLYTHRGHDIIKDEQGIFVVGCLHLFKTLNDARNYVDKTMDSTNRKEPVIVGEWNAEKAGYHHRPTTTNSNR